MGLPTEKLVVATNENDILHRFWKTGHYEKQAVHGQEAEGGLEEDGVKACSDGVKETLSPAMDILVSSNFERLLWYLAYQNSSARETKQRRSDAGEKVKGWLMTLKSEGGFGVSKDILASAKEHFESQRVSDKQTINTIKHIHSQALSSSAHANGATNGDQALSVPTKGTQHAGHYILDPHSAIGIAASLRSIADNPSSHHISLATAHPAKFSHAVELALKDVPGFTFESVLPEQFVGLEGMEKRISRCDAEWRDVRGIVVKEVEEEKKGAR